ncbi:MAG TPA: hypothetical protein DD723_00690 [Candidatus Omnitrophica bacterium]|nr:MAG: hypothetical protein A2Z81_09415 [Omnitrophica WOR_2 bacterium GWA2_45_18]OGX20377.1 MAG: hypothetical protein A2Y04_02990 [Omnitrophica WOR_2 bacterium GWC2_45_7]HBR14048.1 hypothetical protein [Candidatus Omnitrophota bacterium]
MIKKISTNIFIVLVLGMMALANILSDSGPYYLPYNSQQPTMIKATQWFNNLQGAYYNLCWTAGLRNYWRMFAPVDRFNWQFIITAVYPDGGKERILMPSQQKQNFIEYNFVNFREGKYELNIYNDEKGQAALGKYFCRTYKGLKDSVPQKIEIERTWQIFVATNKEDKNYFYRHPTWTRQFVRAVSCEDL